jgi:HEAT repeat protein
MSLEEMIEQLLTASTAAERASGAELLRKVDYADAEVINALIRGLADAETEVRRACLRTLLSLWRSLNAPPLVSYPSAEPGQDPDQLFANAVPALRMRLLDQHKHVRVEAAEVLRNLYSADDDVLNVFVASAQDPDDDLRRRAAYAFWQGAVDLKLVSSLAAPFLGGGRAPLPGVDSERVITILSGLVLDANIEVSGYAINALRSMGIAASAAEPALNQALQDGDENVRFKSAGALASIGITPDLAVAALIRGLTDSDRLKRKAAAFALAESGAAAKAATGALISALHDEEPRVRARCAKALGNIGPEVGDDAIHALFDLETDSEQIVRSATARALEAIGNEAIDAAHHRAASFSARNAFPLLGFKVDDILGLISMLRDPKADVRAYAATALRLAPGNTRAAIPDLIELLKDEDEDVRRRAAETLKAIGDPSGPQDQLAAD